MAGQRRGGLRGTEQRLLQAEPPQDSEKGRGDARGRPRPQREGVDQEGKVSEN